jgi:copper chaperone CopZ
VKRLPSVLLALATLLGGAGAAWAQPRAEVLSVEGWACDRCAKRTEDALRAVTGVLDVATDVPRKRLTVRYEDTQVKLEDIRAAVQKAGFSCELPKDKDNGT